MKHDIIKYSISKGEYSHLFTIKYLKINDNYIHFKLEFQIIFYENQNIY